MKNSQVWSMDIMIAVVIFIGSIFVFYYILSDNEGDKLEELQNDASKVMENIVAEDSNLSITDGVKIDDVQLSELLKKEYLEIKERVRSENDFCIYFEDEDGNIIYVDPNDLDRPGIGSDKIKFILPGGIVQPCGTP